MQNQRTQGSEAILARSQTLSKLTFMLHSLPSVIAPAVSSPDSRLLGAFRSMTMRYRREDTKQVDSFERRLRYWRFFVMTSSERIITTKTGFKETHSFAVTSSVGRPCVGTDHVTCHGKREGGSEDEFEVEVSKRSFLQPAQGRRFSHH